MSNTSNVPPRFVPPDRATDIAPPASPETRSPAPPRPAPPPPELTGPVAVEATALLDNTVVAVKHVTNPRGGRTTRTTWSLGAAGVLLLLVGTIGFFHGVRNAAFNKRALHQWTEIQRRPLHEFRPRRISIAYDWLTFCGWGLGLTALTLALIRRRNEREQPYLRIGTSPGVDVATADAPAPAFALVAPAGDDFVVNIAGSMRAELVDANGIGRPVTERDTQPSTSETGALALPLTRRAMVRLRAGQTTFVIAAVTAPARHAAPGLATVDPRVAGFVGASLAAHVLGLILLGSIPPDSKSLAGDVLDGDLRLSRVQGAPAEDPRQEEVAAEQEPDEGQAGSAGAKMALNEGAMGSPESRRSSGRFAAARRELPPQVARQQALEAARTAGIVGALRAAGGSNLVVLASTAAYSSGLFFEDVAGGLTGSEVADMHGAWGGSLRGPGPGGGGTNTVGVGRYHTIGSGPGVGQAGYGPLAGKRLGTRQAGRPNVRIEPPTVAGQLDRSIIRRHIRSRLAQISYCYERQLVAHPDLAGTVLTDFLISGTGAVVSVTASGLANRTAEDCIAATIQSIQFPRPTGDGMVRVRYPFTFRPAGS
jgi:hypothetical protein